MPSGRFVSLRSLHARVTPSSSSSCSLAQLHGLRRPTLALELVRDLGWSRSALWLLTEKRRFGRWSLTTSWSKPVGGP